MKTLKISDTVIILPLLLLIASCQKLDKINVNPNAKEKVPSGFILTYVTTGTAQLYKSLGDAGSGVSGTMQYIQKGTNENAEEVNHYLWPRASWTKFYDLLRNNKIIGEQAIADNNKFFSAISLTLKSFLFGTLTDLYGDVPYSESLQAATGTYFPKYDKQQDVYKGILQDLRTADSILASADISQYPVLASSDLLYQGNPDKWRKFVNSLRLRYCMRLFNKKSEMSGLGIDIVSEFNEAATHAFQSNSDDASVSYLGTTNVNSAPGGLLNSANPPYLNKPCKTIVDTLKAINDPRLQRWVMPVKRKWNFGTVNTGDSAVKNMFGETYTVTYLSTANPNLDTSLYVGLPMGLATVDLVPYNAEGSFTYFPEQNPYISLMHPRYRQNNDTYLKMDLMMYSEVEFLLAEAAQKAIFSVTDAETHYKNGITASLKRWGIEDGKDGFDFNIYYSNSNVNYASAENKLERIMEQKWISLWLNVESWFDWRRTGYPDLKAGPVAQYGSALPLRFMYPLPSQDVKYLVNYNKAVEGLEPTVYVPSGQSNDHSYSKMWLLQQ